MRSRVYAYVGVWVWVCTTMKNKENLKKVKIFLELSFFCPIFAAAKHENNGQIRQENTTNKYC